VTRPAWGRLGRRSWWIAGSCLLVAALGSGAAAVRDWEASSPASPAAPRIDGAAYRQVAAQLRAFEASHATLAPGLQSCGSRLGARSYDAPPTCFRATSTGFVDTAFTLWTTLGRLDATVARSCQAQLRRLRFQLDLEATVVRQTNTAVESLDFAQFHSLADAIPRLAPMEIAARRTFVGACAPSA
jgi:hypothetical protein